MSYCVHCGVELDPSLKKCPLCNTPVLDPHVMPYYEAASPYPTKRGQVEPVKRKDLAILVSILLISCAVTCGFLNLLVFDKNAWSLLVIGLCLLLWIICIPFLIYRKTAPWLAILFDALGIAGYLFIISRLTHSSDWFWLLGLPITGLAALLLELSMLLGKKLSHSFLSVALYLFTDIALFCIGVELLCRNYIGQELKLVWSAVVLTVCVVFIIALSTTLFIPRLREAARRRLHF